MKTLITNIFNECKNTQQLIEAKNKLIKQYINPILEELKLAKKEEKKDIGLKLKQTQDTIEELFLEYQNNFNSNIDFQFTLKPNELDLDFIKYSNGNKHILNIIIDQIYNFFDSLDFKIIFGDEITDINYNFEKLNISKEHPARMNNDSLFISENILLRTHCTSSTAKVIENNHNEDIRIVSVGNVYRNDDDDATHSHQFMQLDLVWIKEKISLANLKWLVDNFLKIFFSPEIKTRYRLSYFPFTEPSFEVDISCFKCNNKGCSFCKDSGWIEIMGAGVLHPNVLKQANITDKQGIAAGIGLERLAMLKYEFNDIRNLYSNQYSINKQFK